MNKEEKKVIEKVSEYVENRESNDIHISTQYNDLYGYPTSFKRIVRGGIVWKEEILKIYLIQ